MNKILIAGAAALLCTTSANADTVIHFTGSTAFRASAVAAIETLMGGAGNFKAAFQNTSGANTSASNQCVIQGTIAGLPAGANPVTIKCSWSGSTGGIKTVVQNLDVTTWMSISNLPVGNSSVGVAAPVYTLDTTQFPGETLKADVTMEDSAQASTGFTTITLTETRVGVLAFEWVAGNGSPAALDNMTPLLAQAVISGGAPLSQFTGNVADTGVPVYVLGRNFDSGTRLSCLAETGVGVFGGVQHIQAEITGTAGAAGSSIGKLKLWPAETVLGQAFAIGQSGFNSGGTLADNLATPGAAAADTTTGIPPAQQVLFGAGHLVGYLGRSDASRACRTSAIPTNTAHRLKWNGFQLWNGPIAANGTPASYNDNLITEGLYQLWEYQNLAYRSTYAGNGKLVADAIAAQITSTTATLSGTKLSDMNVSKAVEGGIITHN
jgi:hypothetical protein